ncbi:MAG: hypothetical protein KAJ19_14070 [Gammaproteobacteria bacterium]|nr:hypothetical protein [Gammaproteobacteria bacterium]
MNSNEKTIFVKELSQRNAATAQEGLRQLDSRLSGLYDTIMAQQQTIADLTVRTLRLEQEALFAKARAAGTGPTG